MFCLNLNVKDLNTRFLEFGVSPQAKKKHAQRRKTVSSCTSSSLGRRSIKARRLVSCFVSLLVSSVLHHTQCCCSELQAERGAAETVSVCDMTTISFFKMSTNFAPSHSSHIFLIFSHQLYLSLQFSFRSSQREECAQSNFYLSSDVFRHNWKWRVSWSSRVIFIKRHRHSWTLCLMSRRSVFAVTACHLLDFQSLLLSAWSGSERNTHESIMRLLWLSITLLILFITDCRTNERCDNSYKINIFSFSFSWRDKQEK